MDLSSIIARLEVELQHRPAASGDPTWDAIVSGVEKLKNSGHDYEKAHAAFSLIMRVPIDHWIDVSNTIPSLGDLAVEMGKWRRARNVEARRREP